MQRPKPTHPPLFSYPPVQFINNPDSSNSQLHFQSNSLHKNHTYHYGPKATAYLLTGLSASTPVLAFHYPEKLGNIFKWHVIQIMPSLSLESSFGVSSHQNPQYALWLMKPYPTSSNCMCPFTHSGLATLPCCYSLNISNWAHSLLGGFPLQSPLLRMFFPPDLHMVPSLPSFRPLLKITSSKRPTLTILIRTAPASALLPQHSLVYNPLLFFIKALITAWHYTSYFLMIGHLHHCLPSS